jgi:O-antigen ligase
MMHPATPYAPAPYAPGHGAPPAMARTGFWQWIWPWLAFALMAISPFVQREPAPYDFMLIALMGLFVLSLPRVPAGFGWPALFVTMLLMGYAVGAMFAVHHEDALLYMRTSAFLSISLVFFAALVFSAPERITGYLMTGYVLAAIAASLLAISAYFGAIPNAEAFAVYGRATGPFKDPNVYGPFLVLPALYLAHRLATRRPGEMLWSLPAFLLLLLGLFLSFSRGAWFNFAVAALVFLALSHVSASNPRERSRLIGFTVLLGIVGTAAIAWALTLDAVRDLFTTRAALIQDYDTATGGRFDSMLAALRMALGNPLGIGPDQWPRLWGLMPHNVYVNVFVSGGLIAFAGYVALTVTTLWVGLRALPHAGMLRGVLIVAIAAFAGHAAEGFIIDTNHWRHLYVVIGLVWGLALAVNALPRRA